MMIAYKEIIKALNIESKIDAEMKTGLNGKLLIGQIIHRVQLPVLCANLDATQLAKERAGMIHIEKLIKCKRIWQNKFLICGIAFAMYTETKGKKLSFTLLAKYLE
jgi:hypothetical protein